MTKSSEKPQDFTEAVESAGENSEFDISVRSPSGEVMTTYRLVKLSDTMFNVPTVNNLRSIGPPVEFVPTVGEESITWAEGEVLKIKDRKNPQKSICFGALVSLSVTRLKSKPKQR